MTIAQQIADLPPHSLEDRRAAVRTALAAAGLDRLIVASSGLHMIDLPNSVLHLTGFRSVGPCFVEMGKDGSLRALGAPRDDVERLARAFPDGALAADDVATEAARFLSSRSGRAGHVGFDLMPHAAARAALAGLGEAAVAFDRRFHVAAAVKTTQELAAACSAAEIAEAGYVELLRIARPGLRECDLAVAINLFMKERGADDSFLMLNAAARADAVMPSSERPLERGDLILSELSPCVDGQFVQICRTAGVGCVAPEARDAYALLTSAMNEGVAAARPGARLGDVCRAIDDFLTRRGFGQFSRPPFIRRRGHGLGAGSVFPGDVAVDNDVELEPGLLFVVHPNQFLPATGYMMCGEPLVVGRNGPILLSERSARLDCAGFEP